jgi:hypothetical protein
MSTTHKPIKSDLVLNRAQAKSLVHEIASMCEKAYRRGAHQAVALKISESDAAWYRYYGTITKNGCLGFYR